MAWAHTPRTAFLAWIVFTFPFTIWDAIYIILRPHSLPGHKWHEPIWIPVAKYAAVDGIYGEEAWAAGEGWTAAQGVINVTEVSLYLVYFWIVQSRGRKERKVKGRDAGLACVIGLIAGTMTLTKSVLYCEFDECLLWGCAWLVTDENTLDQLWEKLFRGSNM